MNDFTQRDAQGIVNLVRRAPLQNMDEAEVITGLLQRFVEWANAQFAPPAPPARPDAPTAEALRAAGIAVPPAEPVDGQHQD